MLGQAPRADRHGRFFENDGAQLYLEIIGAGEPVLLLHGGTGNVEEMDDIADQLAETHLVISANLRGHGRSNCVLSSISYQKFAADSLAILASIKAIPSSVIGFSDGANAGLLMAAQQPEKIKKLIAIGGNISSSGLREEMRGEHISPELDFFATMQALWRTEIIVAEDMLAKITAPTLIIGGDRDECIYTAHFVEIFQRLPHGFLSIVPGANHCQSAYRADVIKSIILPFIAD